ncbi:hypothetical protein SAMN05216464_102335 [Mucilaginibacter pineti]|uniref:Uncharacterized protein n=1 Tax=Mucilaginibacter pineti TaxID=1391627 RepID=A0A1G6WXS5_9SPHI|nr:hypothetical protein SAMN05216464_102335 [Mucilaginibacter pineti]
MTRLKHNTNDYDKIIRTNWLESYENPFACTGYFLKKIR